MEIVNELLSNQSDYLNALRNAQQMPFTGSNPVLTTNPALAGRYRRV